MTALIFGFTFTSQAADKSGKYSIGMESGYAIPLGDFSEYHDESVILGANGGYWINNKILTGLGILYHLNHHNNDSEMGHSINILSVIPQIKVSVFEGPITPTAGLGIGIFRYGLSHDGSRISFGFVPSAEINLDINEYFSLEANLKFNCNYNFEYNEKVYYLIIGAGANYHF